MSARVELALEDTTCNARHAQRHLGQLSSDLSRTPHSGLGRATAHSPNSRAVLSSRQHLASA
eukprot:3927303-Amphidinium_carterae.1